MDRGRGPARASAAQDRLLAIFDLFDEWFRSDTFEGCSFIHVLLESTNRDGPVARACMRHLERLRDVVRGFAADAGLRDVDNFAHAFHLLMQVMHAEAGDA